MITNIKAVTVFNGRNDNATRRKKYIPTVIYGVSYAEAKGSTVANNGVWSDDVQYKIRVPLASDIQDDRKYIPDMDYEKLDDVEAVKYWTINKSDFIIQGKYAGENSLLYEDEIIKYVKENGPDLIHITEYADNTLGGSIYMRHWRIGGK